jgi:alpha-beta hydrolase superfamily lysophospholipase
MSKDLPIYVVGAGLGGVAAALGLARKAPARGAGLLALALVAEGLLLSPIEPILPGASAAIPPLYAQADLTVVQQGGLPAEVALQVLDALPSVLSDPRQPPDVPG